MQSEAERALRNLRVIASLMHNDKLNTEGDTFTAYAPTAMRGAVRKYYGEHREGNVLRVQETMRAAKAFVVQALSCDYGSTDDGTVQRNVVATTMQQQCCRMLAALESALVGLDHLRQTYKDDASISAKLDIVSDEIRDFLGAVATTRKSLHVAPRMIT